MKTIGLIGGMSWDEIIGKRAIRKVERGEPVGWEMIEKN